MKWQTVLGFEVHVELSTRSKMFCGCPADHFGKPPNTQTCPVCLGLPGALPVPNAKAIEWCIKLGLALGCQINLFSKFDRKNYFYPDLPKGYQISQYDLPFCHSGSLTLSSGKIIRITRVHMEEDTGKLQHAQIDGQKVSLVDFNRSGVPLVEIVTEPDFDNTDDAMEYLKEIQLIVRTLGISSADMEKGSMRLEANISVRKGGQATLPKYKIEVKNVNSFRFVKKAIEFEVVRQIEILSAGKIPVQETRGFNETTGETFTQRLKEVANEYRYFPEPDIPPLVFTKDQISVWQSELPKLPDQKRRELTALGITAEKSGMLVADPQRLSLYEQLIDHRIPSPKAAEAAINVPGNLVDNPTAVLNWISEKTAVSVDPQIIIQTVSRVINDNPKAVSDYQAGKQASLYFLVGMVRRELGNADAGQITEELKHQL